MSSFDIIVLVVVGTLTIIGFYNGMVRQLFGLAGFVAGYILAMRYYQQCSGFLTSFHPGTARAISFIAIFLACILAAHIIGWLVGRFFNISGLGFLNRIGGGFLGFLKGCLIVSLIVLVVTASDSAKSSFFKKSHTVKYVLPVASILKKVTREDIKAKYNEKIGKEKPVSPKQKPGSYPAL
jgi:membrane protein required for colicin V production